MLPEQILAAFPEQRILVVGDVMVDHYVRGKTERIAAEAPVAILKVDREDYLPGGAANVARNVRHLGAAVFLIGITGNDRMGGILQERLADDGIAFVRILDERRTTVKQRGLTHDGHMLFRADHEDVYEMSAASKAVFLNEIKKMEVDAIIVSDYAKGVICKEVMDALRALGIPLIIDTRPQHKKWYYHATLITPNLSEGQSMSGKQDVDGVGTALMEELDTNVLLTLSKDGMKLFEKGVKPVYLPAHAVKVFDVTGAGDTVAAVAALSIAAGASLEQAAELANLAASIVVGIPGTATVSREELMQALRKL